MPVFNERDTVRRIVAAVEAVPVPKEIIIVDDGSTDGSRDILRNLKLQAGRVIFHDRNRGKGAAVRTALRYATGELAIIQDADLEYDPMDYLKLMRLILEGQADVVYGSRWHRGAGVSYRRYLWGGRLLSALVGILYGCRIHDEPTCYKMFRTHILKGLELESEGFDFCPEVTAKVLRLGYRIRQVPISYRPRGFEEGKKISWKDGLTAIWTLVKWRLLPVKEKAACRCAGSASSLR